MRRPTERRAYLAARQLAYHRERLPWMRERMEENESLLRERLKERGERRLVLSGFAIARAENGRVIVGRLPLAENSFQQLELDVIRTTEGY
jgi:hypothetical protein